MWGIRFGGGDGEECEWGDAGEFIADERGVLGLERLGFGRLGFGRLGIDHLQFECGHVELLLSGVSRERRADDLFGVG